MHKDLLIEVGMSLICVVIAALFFWPVLQDPLRNVVDDYDGVFVAFIQNKVMDKVLSNQLSFDADIFYPHQNTLAYSELFLSQNILSLPLRMFTHEPLVVVSYNLILAQALTLLFSYFLFTEVSEDRRVGFVLALAFSFSTLRLMYIGHLHVLAIQWVFVAILSLIKISKNKHWAWWAALCISFFLQVTNSFLSGYFIIFCTILWLIVDNNFRKRLIKDKKVVIGLGLLSAIGLWFFSGPYLSVSHQFNYIRPIRDVAHFSSSINEIWWIVLGLGFLFKNRMAYWAFGLTGISGVLALGPVLKWFNQTVKWPVIIPLPYIAFYYLFPGFNGFRTPSRWIILSLIGLMVLLASWIKGKNKLIKIGFCGLVLIYTAINLPAYNVKSLESTQEYPAYVAYLENRSEKVMIELPMFRWGSDKYSQHEVVRMLYQLKHGKKLINGYSGFSPPEWEELVSYLYKNFPSGEAIEKLKQRGVELVLVDVNEFQELGLGDIEKNTDVFANQLVKLVKLDGVVVYKVK